MAAVVHEHVCGSAFRLLDSKLLANLYVVQVCLTGGVSLTDSSRGSEPRHRPIIVLVPHSCNAKKRTACVVPRRGQDEIHKWKCKLALQLGAWWLPMAFGVAMHQPRTASPHLAMIGRMAAPEGVIISKSRDYQLISPTASF
jgi:hypothetical protein